jgi:O-antigen ligase
MFISIFISEDFKRGFNILIHFFSTMLLPYAILTITINNTRVIEKGFIIWIIIAVIDSFLTLAQVLYGSKFYLMQYIFPSYLENFNMHALPSGALSGLGLFDSRAYNGLFLFVASVIILVNMATKKWRFLISFPPLLIITIAILSTNSRTAIALLPLSIILLIVLNLFNRSKTRVVSISLSLLVMMGIFIFYFLSNAEHGSDLITTSFSRFEHSYYDFQSRRDYWLTSINLLNEPADYLIGRGLGITGNLGNTVEVHNAYLELFVEIGVVGITLWLMFVYLALRNSMRILNIITQKKEFISISFVTIIIIISLSVNSALGSSSGASIREGDLLIILPFAIVQSIYQMLFRHR